MLKTKITKVHVSNLHVIDAGNLGFIQLYVNGTLRYTHEKSPISLGGLLKQTEFTSTDIVEIHVVRCLETKIYRYIMQDAQWELNRLEDGLL